MIWSKVLKKTLFGLFTGVIATVTSNPDAVTTLAGASHTAKVSAIIALLSGINNFLKHRGD